MNTKKLLRIIPVILITALLIVSSVFALTSCGDDPEDVSGVTDIFFAKAGAPRDTYVLGQDLDLTKGTLTVVVDGANTSLALNADGVTITGYNSEVLGQQEITVSYMDHSTTYKVTVIPRITPESYETDYFKGDDFNNQKGRLKVANDDGSTYLVNMNDPAVSLKSFNSATTGTASITIEYAKDDTTTYEATFDVTVHAPDTIIFTPPKKTSYQNHEELLDLTGGYFTVKAAAPSNLSKMVELTQQMVTGYNPESVTIANRTDPVVQTILVNYAGYSDSFDVSVVYSSVKIVRDQAEKLVNIDFEKAWDEITLPAGAGTAAFDGIKEYFTLSNRDKSLVGEELVDALVKTATFYLTGRYESELDALSNAFIINFRQNAYLLVGESPTAVKIAIDTLEDENSNFNVIASLLRAIKDEFGDESFNSSYTIKNVFSVHTDDMMANSQGGGILTSLKHVIKVYESMPNFPADWDDDTLREREDDILAAASAIRLSNMHGPAYESVYGMIRNWRVDFFDIIYAYYFNIVENGAEEVASKIWNVIPAPSKVNNWYMSYLNAYNFLYSQEKNSQGNFIGLYFNQNSGRDLFEFHYYYATTVKIGNEILQGPDDANKKMYLLLDGNAYVDVNLRCAQAIGYINLMGVALGDEAVEKTWDSYLVLLDLVYRNNGQVDEVLFASNSSAFEAFAKNLAALTPTQLHSFLSSTYYRYSYAHSIGAPQSDAFEFLQYSPQNYVTYLLANYFSTKLTSNGMIVLQQILSSMEQASLMHVKDAATANFQSAAANLLENYISTNLTGADKSVLQSCFGVAVDRCLFMYNQLFAQNPANPTEAEKESLDALNDALNAFDALLQRLNELNAIDLEGKTDAEKAAINQQKSDLFALLVATFDSIDSQYYGIINGTDNRKFHLSSYKYSVEVNGSTIYYTLDTRLASARYYFISLMVSSGINNVMAWDVYHAYGLKGELAKLLPLLKAELDGDVVNNALDYKAIFDSFSNNCKIGTLMITGRLYSAGLQRYYNSILSAENKALELTEKLLTAEQLYWAYQSSVDAEALASFNSTMNDINTIYATITDQAQKDNFDSVLGDLYEKYLAIYNELNDEGEPV